MKLRAAIMKAAAIAGSGPIALVGSQPGRVITHQGPLLVSYAIDADEQVPWGRVAAKALSRAVRDMAGEPRLEADAQGLIVRAEGSVARVPSVDAPIPSIPAVPVLHAVPDWAVIEQVLHAAGSDSTDRPELTCVRFGPESTDATDAVRIARALVGIGGGQLVPAQAFVRWPREANSVRAAFSDAHAWFAADDELRIAKLSEGWFPSLEHVSVGATNGPRVRAPRLALEQAVTRAWKASPMKAVHLRIVGGAGDANWRAPHITVSRLSRDAGTVAFESRIEVEGGADAVAEYVFDGRRLTEALKALRGESAVIGYQPGGREPVRFEADRYVEVLWPRVPA